MAECVIIGAGEIKDKNIISDSILPGDYVICADGGYLHLNNTAYIPDEIIGDFDSSAVPEFENVTVLPKRKDITDTCAAFNRGLEKGYRSFVLLGCTGGRFDHTFANLKLMYRNARNGINTVLRDEKNIIFFIKDNESEIRYNGYDNLSFFAFAEKIENFNILNAEYELKDYTLYPEDSLCVSNSFKEDKSPVKIRKSSGIILTVQSK